eukprot:scaffold25236_cov45-Prasinocladus_malaysianus.AAC.1
MRPNCCLTEAAEGSNESPNGSRDATMISEGSHQLGVGIVGAAVLAEEVVVVVLVGVLLTAHEQHVLEVVTQAL